MAIFNCYVSSPEGNYNFPRGYKPTNITNIAGGHHGAPQIHMAVVAAGAWRGARAVGAPEFCGDVGRRDEAAEKQDGRDGIAAPWGKWWELTNDEVVKICYNLPRPIAPKWWLYGI